MSTLIYCKNSIAASPYYIEEASLNVYSLEELSYFILNNVYLLSRNFMTPELCNWIGRELKQKQLQDELMDMIRNNAPLHLFIGHLLASNGYSSKKEIKDTLAIISTFENKSEAECKKMRADRLMAADKVVDAIYEYESLLADDLARTMSRSVEGDVYHNLGCAFAKLFFFEEAIRCFDEAYKRNQKLHSLNCLLYAARCKRDKKAFDDAVTKYQVPATDVQGVMTVIKNVAEKVDIAEFDKAVNELEYLDGDNEEFFEQTGRIIDNWRQEYTRLCRI